MGVRRFLLGSLLASSALFASYPSVYAQDPVKNNATQKAQANLVSVDNAARKNTSLDRLVKRLENVPGNDKVNQTKLFDKGVFDRKDIQFRFPSLKNEGGVFFRYGPEGIKESSHVEMTERLHTLLNYVYNDGIRDSVWDIGLADLGDDLAEHGGLVFDDSYRPFKSIASNIPRSVSYYDTVLGLTVKSFLKDSNERYSLDERFLVVPHVAEFHLHFVDEHGHKNLDPSGAWNNRKRTEFSGDLGYSLERIFKYDTNHQIVITKVRDTETVNIPLVGKVNIQFRKSAMNFKYFGGYKQISEDEKSIDLYMHVVNLGTFEVGKRYKEKK